MGGKVPSVKQLLYMSTKAPTLFSIAVFRALSGMSSGADALLSLMLFHTSRFSISVTCSTFTAVVVVSYIIRDV